MNQFKNKLHEKAFKEFIEQGEDQLTRSQKAFLYLIAMYQEDYEHYEGMRFYIEVYEEVSIDGPVYLLEDCVNLENFPHEKILKFAKDLLKGHKPDIKSLEAEDIKFAEIAYNFAINS